MTSSIAHSCGHTTRITADCRPFAQQSVRSNKPCPRCQKGAQCADLLEQRGLGHAEFAPAEGHAGGTGLAGYVAAALVSSYPAYHQFADRLIGLYERGEIQDLSSAELAARVVACDLDPAQDEFESRLGF